MSSKKTGSKFSGNLGGALDAMMLHSEMPNQFSVPGLPGREHRRSAGKKEARYC